MSMVAQKQDISDPEVIENFAKKVGTMERLVSLYLLTVCDIRATGPKIWNAWKAQLLEDLFYSTARFLKGKGIDRDLLVSRRRKDALRLTRFTPEQRDRINKFWDNFDVAYFMKHSVRNNFLPASFLICSNTVCPLPKPVSTRGTTDEWSTLSSSLTTAQTPTSNKSSLVSKKSSQKNWIWLKSFRRLFADARPVNPSSSRSHRRLRYDPMPLEDNTCFRSSQPTGSAFWHPSRESLCSTESIL